ncbi:MAG: PaaI family thioesterase [Spirochaetota bacterium]
MYKRDELEKYRKIPNQKEHHCFGCGPANIHGLQLKFYTDETSVFTHLQIPERMAGWSRVVHGGITATVLDETMAWTCIYLQSSYILTKSMQVDYIRPIYVGEDLQCVGSIESIEGDKAEVLATIYNGDGKECSRSLGKMKLFTPEGIRKLGIFTEDFLAGFEEEVFQKF